MVYAPDRPQKRPKGTHSRSAKTSGDGASSSRVQISVFAFLNDEGSKAYTDLESERDTIPDFLPTIGPPEWPSIQINDVNPNILTCPMKIIDQIIGVEFNGTLFAGQMSFEATLPEQPSEQRLLLKPRNDWALVVSHGEVELNGTGDYSRTEIPGVCWWETIPAIAGLANPPTEAPTTTPTLPPSAFPCFSSGNTVEEIDRGVIFMDELKIGDRVRVTENTFSRVYCLGHWDHTVRTEYLQIYYEGAPATPLEKSKDQHLLFVVSFNGSHRISIPASKVVIGDSVVTSEGSAQVTKIQKVTRAGAYTPFTEAGALQVNGVLASSYVTLQTGSEVLQMGGIKMPIRMQWLAHLATAPRRWVCYVYFGVCENEAYTSDGIASWIPLRSALWYLDNTMEIWTGLMLAVAFRGRFWKHRSRRCCEV